MVWNRPLLSGKWPRTESLRRRSVMRRAAIVGAITTFMYVDVGPGAKYYAPFITRLDWVIGGDHLKISIVLGGASLGAVLMIASEMISGGLRSVLMGWLGAILFFLFGLIWVLGCSGGVFIFLSLIPWLIFLFYFPTDMLVRYVYSKRRAPPIDFVESMRFCAGCGYNLTGTIDAGVRECPECGAKLRYTDHQRRLFRQEIMVNLSSQ